MPPIRPAWRPSVTTIGVGSVFVTCLSLMTAAVFYGAFHDYAGRLVRRWTKRPEGVLLATTVIVAIGGGPDRTGDHPPARVTAS